MDTDTGAERRLRLGDLGAAHQFLDRWLASACPSPIPSFVRLLRTIRAHRTPDREGRDERSGEGEMNDRR